MLSTLLQSLAFDAINSFNGRTHTQLKIAPLKEDVKMSERAREGVFKDHQQASNGKAFSNTASRL